MNVWFMMYGAEKSACKDNKKICNEKCEEFSKLMLLD